MSTFTYDGNGNLLSVTDAVHASTPTTYTYDSMDRLKTRTDPLLRQESYTYYSNGNINTFRDRKSQTTTFSFDSLNRLTGAQFQDNSTIGYVFDSAGRIQYINDSIAGQIARTYDNLDLLTSETTPLGVVSYVNDALGRRSSMTTPGQTALTYGYDSGDRLNQITQGTTPQVSITYDTAGRRSTLTLPNGIVATYGYDTSSRLASISYDKSGTHVGDLSYGYDTLGRRTSMGGTMARANLPAATTALAAYNVDNQFTSWNGTTLSYDLNGNMSNDGVRAFSWNARNQLASIGTTTFQYDGTARRSQNGAAWGLCTTV